MRLGHIKRRCFVCDGEILDDFWFARFPVGGQRELFCQPYCVVEYLANQGVYIEKAKLYPTVEMPVEE